MCYWKGGCTKCKCSLVPAQSWKYWGFASLTLATCTWKEVSLTRMLTVTKETGDKCWVLDGRLDGPHRLWLSTYANARLTKYVWMRLLTC